VIERGVELGRLQMDDGGVDCELRHADGRVELVRCAYLVGCDGAHSTVRKGAGFSFEGGSYPQEFVLADVEADGPLEPGAINSFVGGGGVAMFFPLGDPRTWRVIAMRAADTRAQRVPPGDESVVGPLSLEELQAIVASPTDGSVTPRDPAWLTRFRLHHRQIAHYRKDRVFLAGDAAHIHSPVGAQGMNTGIQDAWNLGWKLTLVAQRRASARLLDSYEAERWPVGRFLLRYTDRVFGTFTRVVSGGRLATWARAVVVPRLLPALLGSSRLRTTAFRFVSELAIHYRRSPAVCEGEPRLRRGPRAGDRLPDHELVLDGQPVTLHRTIGGANTTLLLCDGDQEWDERQTAALQAAHRGLLRLVRLARQPAPGVLVDEHGGVLASLGAHRGAQYLVRPDGYIGFRCAGQDFEALISHLAEWYPAQSSGT
jgi:2-polyprenyl-6-methoxyphenol hydroxylase-like FAD-dependent oxidoreductase